MNSRSTVRILVLLFCLGACAPRLQPGGTESAEPRLLTESWQASDGREMPLRRWQPDGAPRAIIIALHGFNDYGAAFSEPAEWLSKHHQISVYAMDQRGFGAGPYRGFWAGRERLSLDVREQTRALRGIYPDRRIYWLGESMGGAVALAALPDARGSERPDGVILSAPAVWGRASMPWFYGALLGIVSHTVPWLELTGRGLGIQASDNIPMLRRLSADPLVIKSTRVDSIFGLVGLMDAASATAQVPDPAGLPPLLLLYGARDEVIPRAPVERFVSKLEGRARVAVYPNGWHMLLRDLSAELVWKDIAAWVEDHRVELPSGAEKHALPLFPPAEQPRR